MPFLYSHSFLSSIASKIALTIGLTCSSLGLAQTHADVVITNANIYQHPSANAIAIKNGKILAIGSSKIIHPYFGRNTKTMDIENAFVMPGFIDNHNHVFEAASAAGGNCELSSDASLNEQIPYLKACKARLQKGQWLMGYGFSIDSILGQENLLTPLQVLDKIFPETPVVIMEQTSHSMWVNTAALNFAGINTNTPEPQGGKILKDEYTEQLNGILLDNAGDIVMEMAWNSLKNQFNQSYDGLMTGLETAAAHGITTIGDGRLYWKRGWLDVWKAAEKSGDLTARVSLRPWIYPTDGMDSQLEYLETIQSNNKSNLLVVDQVKMYSDGIFINGTAKTLAPYLYTYIPDRPNGINYIPPQQMKVWLGALNDIGYGAHIHAIGDGAIQESLNAIEYVRHKGASRPYTLTHVELVNSKDISRFAKLNVTADFQVGSDYVAYHQHEWAEVFLGAIRTRSLMNLRAIFYTGANVTLSSDWDVHDINPLVGITNSLKMGKTGLPNITTAIDAYTINAARSLGLEQQTGSIEIGKSADFVVLEKDISSIKVEDIATTEILMTILQGKTVFDIEKQ